MKSYWRVLAIGFVVTAFVGTMGCASREVAKIDPGKIELQRRDIGVSTPKVDVLFVIDNSYSMKEEQTSLRENFPKFIDRLRDQDGILPSLHIGVITTEGGAGYQGKCKDLDLAGRFRAEPNVNPDKNNCTTADAPNDGKLFLFDTIRADGTRTNNHNDDLAKTFGCIAEVGAGECGTEQPLEAIRRAMDFELNPENAQFFRSDAFLAIVMVTDEDDCSRMIQEGEDDAFRTSTLQGVDRNFSCIEEAVICDQNLRAGIVDATGNGRPPTAKTNCRAKTANELDKLSAYEEYADHIIGFKGGRDKVIVAGIMGEGDTVFIVDDNPNEGKKKLSVIDACKHARPPIRLGAFINEFAGQSANTSLCTESGISDLSDPLEVIGELIESRLRTSCFTDLIDLDPTTDEVETDCTVSIVTEGGDQTIYPACNPMSSRTECWQFARNLDECSESQVFLSFGEGEVAETSHVEVECLVRVP